MSQKVFDNDLVVIQKSKITLTLNKPAYVGMYILNLNRALMYGLHYDYIKNKNGSKSTLLFTDIHSLLYEIKNEHVYEDFSKDKKCLTLVIIQLSQNFMMIQANWWLVKSKLKELVSQLKNLLD